MISSNLVGGRSGNSSTARISFLDEGAASHGFDDAKGSKFLEGLSKRGTWGSRIAGAANSIDRVSLKTGAVLRRHSLLRVLIVLYVLCLHLWVFVAMTFAAPLPPGKAPELGPKV
jgi:hypothetical protein